MADDRRQNLPVEERQPSLNVSISGNVQNLFLSPQTVNISASNQEQQRPVEIDDIIGRANTSVKEACGNDVETPFDNLTIPERKENPVMKRTPFYKGAAIGQTYDSRGRGWESRIRDFDWGQQRDVILNDLHDGSVRHSMLVGYVGIGKSTLVKRYCKMVLDGGVQALREVRLVLFLPFGNIEASDSASVQSVLLGPLTSINEPEKDQLFQWMVKNTEKILVALDGLDQAKFIVEGSISHVGYDGRSSTKNIILNIFEGHLFGSSRLFTSSREWAASRLTERAQPDCVIYVCGLKNDSIERLIKGFGGNEGERIWGMLKPGWKGFLPLLESPLFLTLATALCKENPRTPPNTLSGMMMNVLLNFVHLEASRLTQDLLRKLMKISFDGIANCATTFCARVLKQSGIKLEEVRDLVITMPKKTLKIVHQRLLEGDVTSYFCHLSFQETLAALFVINMDLAEFKVFVETELYNPRWDIVRRIVYGSMLNPDTFAVVKDIFEELDPNLDQKKNILKRAVEDELKSEVPIRMAMYNILRESGSGADEIIRDLVTDIRPRYKWLTKIDMHNIMSVVTKKDTLKYVAMTYCDLKAQNLTVFEQAMRAKSTKIETFEIRYNYDTGEEGCKLLGNLVKLCDVKDFTMRKCRLKPNELRGLKNAFKDMNIRIPKLDLCENQFEQAHVQQIIELLPHVTEMLLITKEDMSDSKDLEEAALKLLKPDILKLV